MTLASALAHLICEEIEPVPGVIHDPTQPLILGDQAAQNYTVITWDAVAHRVQIQSVYKPPGAAPLQQATLTLSSTGQLLLNGGSIADIPEIQQAVTAAQQAASQAASSQSAAAGSATQATNSANSAATASNAAAGSATLSQQFALAPEGTSLPGGGDSAVISAQKAAGIAQESRDLDTAGPLTGDETFASGFLFTERQVQPVGGAEVVVTIPPGIFTSAEKKARWGAYKLRSATGSVKFVPQAGGTNLVTPTLVARGRSVFRVENTSTTARRLLDVPIVIPPVGVVDGEVLLVFNAMHFGPSFPSTVTFDLTGGLTWDTISPYEAFPPASSRPQFFLARAMLGARAGQTINIRMDEGVNTDFLAADYFILDKTEGALPFFAFDPRQATLVRSTATATIPGLPAQSLVMGMAGSGAAPVNSTFVSFTTNVTRDAFGNTAGLPDVLASDTSNNRNQAYGIFSGVSTVTADFTVTGNFSSAALKTNIALIGYQPKAVIGGGAVVLNLEGGRDVLSVPYGVAELWFQNDGVTVDVRTPTPIP